MLLGQLQEQSNETSTIAVSLTLHITLSVKKGRVQETPSQQARKKPSSTTSNIKDDQYNLE
jgi:hypothetical protein